MSKHVNRLRKKIMLGLTKNVGKSAFEKGINIERNDVKRVLICRPNHRLGNMLLITPLVQEVEATFPNCTIDVFVKGGAAIPIFENYTTIDKIIRLPKKHFSQLPQYISRWVGLKTKKYDIAINVNAKSSSGRLSTKAARADLKFFGDVDKEFKSKYKDYKHIAKYPVYNFRYFVSKLGIHDTLDAPIPSLNLKLSEQERTNGKKKLDELVDTTKETICIFTYATGAKCYETQWWKECYKQLKANFSEYNILEILPVENVSQIDFEAPSFYSKDVREIASVIANSKVFVGADSGMMHLASASQAPTIGLFSCTDTEVYEPYGNRSTSVKVTKPEDVHKCIHAVANVLKQKE
ncbi:hypothetical protein GCM10007424_18750 [Flavobacterium suaedae]|uniref:Lipopolysaccharide heptosyltransferase family protein n=1 Tax=Flavobacterium suaedae TaxID=1767027 RepID=A0ABQ1JYQ7_9FLAO|nr:glycosyltransferase family 9 protein [Flavobacterium suaedae]GGB78834.1 hypothetical protein GCM10007424_18750 [Flavobacterium suaedae]